MQFLQKTSEHVLHYGALHFANDTLASIDLIRQRVDQDFANSNISQNDCGSYNLVLDFRGEGQCDQSARPLIEYLQSLGFKKVVVLFSAVVDIAALPYAAMSDPEFMANSGQWPQTVSLDLDTKFICLIRRPSHSRACIAQAMLTMSSTKLTFGSGEPACALGEYRSYFPGVDLPLTLDGGIYGDQWHLRLDARNPLFASALFNVVVETSDQTTANAWRSIFITEKTFKAFVLRQIPIWVAVPGLVSAVRNLGFDCFDDIVDHSYDSVTSEQQRHDMVIAQIRQLDQRFSLDQCQALRNSMADRLEANWHRMTQMCDSHLTYQQLLEYFGLDSQV
jgi:hypothetical protein